MTENLFDAGDQSDASERAAIIAKWKDKPREELEAAKAESDLYIKTLEKQKDEFRSEALRVREELQTKAKFEELLDRFEKSPRELASSITNANEVESPKYDPTEVENKIKNFYLQTKIDEAQSKNFNEVQTRLKERFGDSYLSVLKDQQNTLGLSTEDVNVLAKKSPEAFFRIMGLNSQNESFQTPFRSATRNDNFAPRGEPKRTWSYYQALKKSDFKTYSDPKTQIQMHKDSELLGQAFEDGDFHAY